jgi:molybdopterin-guanine dinucleotide biosynthesis protein A
VVKGRPRRLCRELKPPGCILEKPRRTGLGPRVRPSSFTSQVAQRTLNLNDTRRRLRMARDWPPISAAALAGGMSRRMGRDKALLSLEPGGQPLLEIVIERLAAIADEVFVVANDAGRYERFGAAVVPDVYAGTGALGGIHAAVQHASRDHCLVVACDMPLLNLPLLARMAREPRDYDVLVPALPGESRQGRGMVYQTLHAIYAKTCLPAIETRLENEKLQVIGFFDDVRVRTLELAEVARWDPELRSFVNANTPEALAVAAELRATEELTVLP